MNFAHLAVLVSTFPPRSGDAWVCLIFTADATTTNHSLPSIAPSNLASHFSIPPTPYGPYKNRNPSAGAIRQARQRVIATKFGIVRDPKDPTCAASTASRTTFVNPSREPEALGIGNDRPLLPASRRPEHPH